MLDRLLANWPYKALAVSLAFGIWAGVTGENRVVQDFTVPLEILLSEDTALAVSPDTTVQVRLRGLETSIRRLDTLQLGVEVDLQDGLIGERDVPLSAENLIRVPREVEVDFIKPDRLRLVLDHKDRRPLLVEPTILGKPPGGYVLYGAEVFPETLMVEGPQSEVQKLSVLRTGPIRLEDRTSPFTETVATVPESPYVRVIDPRELEVRVVVDVTPEERRFKNVAVDVIGETDEVKVTPDVLDVTLAAPPALLDRIRPELLRAVVDVSDLAPGDTIRAVEVRVDFVGFPAEDLARISVKSLSRRTVDVVVTAQGDDE